MFARRDDRDPMTRRGYDGFRDAAPFSNLLRVGVAINVTPEPRSRA